MDLDLNSLLRGEGYPFLATQPPTPTDTWAVSYKDFVYVVNPKPKDPIFFGSSIERETMPLKGKSLSPFMRRMALEIWENVSPNSYDLKNGALHDMEIKPISKLGLGARSERFPEVYLPTQLPLEPFQRPLKKNCAPFNSTTKRKPLFESRDVPSPSDIYPRRGRKEMKFSYSFNGKKVLRCAVHIKCVPYNLDTCEVCGCSCSQQGDYWLYHDRLALCRTHYAELFTHLIAKFKGVLLRLFKPTRDCFFAHEHNSCHAALKIMTSNEILKKLRREAYLDPYYPQRRFVT